MQAARDWTGVHSGCVTAIERTGAKRNGNPIWRCLCDCGEIVETTSISLRDGGAACPACQLAKRRGPRIDLTGRTFGTLTVLGYAGITQNNAQTWLCICECGREAIVRQGNLVHGRSTTCGHVVHRRHCIVAALEGQQKARRARTCDWCGREFRANRKAQSFCAECRKAKYGVSARGRAKLDKLILKLETHNGISPDHEPAQVPAGSEPGGSPETHG